MYLPNPAPKPITKADNNTLTTSKYGSGICLSRSKMNSMQPPFCFFHFNTLLFLY